jgi:hypothetical protein
VVSFPSFLIHPTAIPKMGYLTTMDHLLMASYYIMLAMAVQTFALFTMSIHGHNEEAALIDWWFGVVTPILYGLIQTFHISRAIQIRTKRIHKAQSSAGVHPNLIESNVELVDAFGSPGSAQDDFGEGFAMANEMRSRASLFSSSLRTGVGSLRRRSMNIFAKKASPSR